MNTKQSNRRTTKPVPSKRRGNGSANRNNKLKSTIDPKRLVQSATSVEVKPYVSELSFAQMNIHKGIQSNLKVIGFASPTEIQEKTYDRLLQKQNLIGIANTGTGKTGAFLIPMLHNMLNEKQLNKEQNGSKALIVVPTRELAVQVQDEFRKLSNGLKMKCSCFIGGTNIAKDLRSARQCNDVIIGTPGRLLDLMNRKALSLNDMKTLVLDEFDRMLDMGFINDIKLIVQAMKKREQTMLFSATKDPKQESLINELVQNPFLVEIHNSNVSSKNVTQDTIKVPQDGNKFNILIDLLNEQAYSKVILFTETKHLADRLSKKLNKSGMTADQIHGNKSQAYRLKALDKFKKGKVKVLVATDVAARGVDVQDVSLVVNYQLPRDFDTYIHRIGRTGRAGKTGMAYTFLN